MFPSPVSLRDPAIKLFGRNIPVTQSNIRAPSLQRVSPFPAMPKIKDECQEAPKSDADNSLLNESFRLDLPSDFELRKESTSESHNRENGIVMNQNSGEDQCAESNNSSKEKPFKRPDKVLPCPRCNSLETKFCYFNNYNVNQPRHFCKNCHRYWTAGGTIRNVPIGSGRRQNKRSYPHFQQAAGHLDATAINQEDNVNSTGAQSSPCSSQTVNDMGGALKFGLDTPLCESMEILLSIKDHKKAEIRSSATGDYSEERSSSSSSLTATTSCENESLGKEYNNLDPTNNLQHCPVQPSAYLWNVGWSTMMAKQDISDSSSSHMASLPMVTVPVGHCASSITFPFVPASCWGYMPTWDGRQWNALSLESTGSLTSSCSINQSGSGNRLPTLGKHSRDGNLQVEENSEQCLWVPKTLRIDNPNVAAKSSIWSTLGIKPQKGQPLKGDGIFKAFKQKIDLNSHEVDGDQVLQSNPAALSRSHSFQEKT